jgi:hypothetical protein
VESYNGDAAHQAPENVLVIDGPVQSRAAVTRYDNRAFDTFV